MPRHSFRFPPTVVEAVRNHVRKAIEAVDPRRYHQESPYTAALANRLEGVAYEGQYGRVEFSSTVANDRGRGSAESVYGADIAITATVTDGLQSVRKAILVQAKLGEISDLNAEDRGELIEQVGKMKKLVDAPKVMQIPESPELGRRRSPQIISGNNLLRGAAYTPMNLESYFVARVTTTFDGCTDQDTVSQVQDSFFTRVNVTAKLVRND